MNLADLARFVSIIALALGCTTRALAATITVGFPAGFGQPCDYDSIQAALSYANSNGDAVNEVRLMYASGVNGFPLTGQSNSLTLDAGKEVTITGGYGSCTQAVADSNVTEIKGLNDPPTFSGTGTVLSIHAGTGSTVTLRLLKISKGATALNDSGGGIYYGGDGTLDIADCEIFSNTAGYGGGIYAEGTGGTNAKLLIGSNVHVFSNGAVYYGGGVRIAGLEMTMSGTSYITQNVVDTGDGGGLAITGHAGKPGKATVSSLGNSISNNTANRGGGVAVMANDSEGEGATLILRSSLVGNFAHYRGGGIFAREEALSFPANWVDANVLADTSAHIDGNAAPDGAAVYLDYAEEVMGYNFGASFSMTTGSIDGNLSMDDGSNFTNGAILVESDGSFTSSLKLSRITMRANHGGPLVRNDDYVEMKDVLIAGNISSSSLIDGIGGDGWTKIIDSTIATNTVAGSYAITQSNDMTLQRVIIDQPGKTTLQHSGGTLTVDNVLSSEEVVSLDAGAAAFVAPPLFVDPADGDYELQAASPAVDRAAADATEAVDLLGRPRNFDLPFKANVGGPRDLGALERQAVPPLVIDGDFDKGDLHLWNPYQAGPLNQSVWEASDHISNGASGSLHVYGKSDNVPFKITAGYQCIYLPGPGRYLLNGWGHRGTAVGHGGDSASLYWEYRYDGYTDCIGGGAPSATGTLLLGNGSNWSHSVASATIDVFAWSANSSIAIYLVAQDGDASKTIDVWFDGITLGLVSLDDLIFSNGFN